jgi:hypothetical protein
MVDHESSFNPQLFIYVMIPEDIQPIARGEKYEDPITSKLEAAGLGAVSGGGSQLDQPNPDGSVRIKFCGIDIDVVALPRALELLRVELPFLAIPVGTELHYTTAHGHFLDRFDGRTWLQVQPRDMPHPGFTVS